MVDNASKKLECKLVGMNIETTDELLAIVVNFATWQLDPKLSREFPCIIFDLSS